MFQFEHLGRSVPVLSGVGPIRSIEFLYSIVLGAIVTTPNKPLCRAHPDLIPRPESVPINTHPIKLSINVIVPEVLIQDSLLVVILV